MPLDKLRGTSPAALMTRLPPRTRKNRAGKPVTLLAGRPAPRRARLRLEGVRAPARPRGSPSILSAAGVRIGRRSPALVFPPLESPLSEAPPSARNTPRGENPSRGNSAASFPLARLAFGLYEAR